jgi:competence protein ComEC
MKTNRVLAVATLFLLLVSTFVNGQEVEFETTIFESDTISDDEASLVVHFIDVGAGDAILIETPSGKNILVDGGWLYIGRNQTEVMKLSSRVYHEYIGHFLEEEEDVDLVILSHPDYDHFIGLHELLQDERVFRQAWYTGYDHDELSSTWENDFFPSFQSDPQLCMSPITDYIGTGSVIRVDDNGTYPAADDVTLELIHAPQSISRNCYGSDRRLNESKRNNSSSLVFRLDFGETSFLFPGDTNGRLNQSDDPPDEYDPELCDDQELYMVRNHENPENPLHGSLDCTVLKVSHHGSDGSSSLRFLKAASPEWAVISAGIPHDHPIPTTVERILEVLEEDSHLLRTDIADPEGGIPDETNLGDDCYQFHVSPEGIVRVEKWSVDLE